jgi:hypothetical protein
MATAADTKPPKMSLRAWESGFMATRLNKKMIEEFRQSHAAAK